MSVLSLGPVSLLRFWFPVFCGDHFGVHAGIYKLLNFFRCKGQNFLACVVRPGQVPVRAFYSKHFFHPAEE
jgi:hypothetical protein